MIRSALTSLTNALCVVHTSWHHYRCCFICSLLVLSFSNNYCFQKRGYAHIKDYSHICHLGSLIAYKNTVRQTMSSGKNDQRTAVPIWFIS